MTLLNFYINNKLLKQPPLEWRDTRIIVNWESAIATPELGELEFTFYGDGYETLLAHFESGNIFKVPQFKLEIINQVTGSVTGIFDGYIDVRGRYVIDKENSRIVAQVKKHNVTQSFDTMLDGLTFGYINSIGKAPKNYEEFKISVEKKMSEAELASAFILEGLQLFAVANVIKSAIEEVATLASLVVAGGLTGSVSALVYAGFCAILEIVYDAYIIYTIADSISRVNETLKVKQFGAYAMSAFDGLTSICSALGLTFDTDIEDLKYTYYIPSAIKLYDFNLLGIEAKVQEKKDGLPNDYDYGYNCKDFFKMFADMFGAKYSITNGKVVLYNLTSQKWQENSTYRVPSILAPQFELNINECFNTKIIKYATDPNNYHSVGFWRGTSAARETILNDGTVNEKGIVKSATLGLNEVEIQASIATVVPDDVYVSSSVDILQTIFGQFIDWIKDKCEFVVGSHSGSSDGNQADGGEFFDNKIVVYEGDGYVTTIDKPKPNKIVVSDQFYSIPQIVYMKNGKMDYKYNTPISALNLMNSSHKATSFVQKDSNGNAWGQYRKISGVTVPFRYSDFANLLNKNHGLDADGNTIIMRSVEWTPAADSAKISYDVRKTYATNLKEKTYEPKGQDDIY